MELIKYLLREPQDILGLLFLFLFTSLFICLFIMVPIYFLEVPTTYLFSRVFGSGWTDDDSYLYLCVVVSFWVGFLFCLNKYSKFSVKEVLEIWKSKNSLGQSQGLFTKAKRWSSLAVSDEFISKSLQLQESFNPEITNLEYVRTKTFKKRPLLIGNLNNEIVHNQIVFTLLENANEEIKKGGRLKDILAISDNVNSEIKHYFEMNISTGFSAFEELLKMKQ